MVECGKPIFLQNPNLSLPTFKFRNVKRVALLVFFLTTLIATRAQENKNNIGTITGRVTDSLSHFPLDYATITLFAKGNAKPLDGTTTNKSGHFQLTNVAPGSYTIVAEFIGYRPVTISNVAVEEKNPVTDLKNIFLSKNSETLQTVVISTQGKIIDNRIDKLVFNAEKDLTSQTGVATDVLKKVPQVSVDVDGNVELSGTSSIRFLINGKPSSAFGSNISDVLQSIPASQIKSIEVITNPGAKYDAQGLGGIINIILKKNNAKGVNGNLSLTAGTRMDNGSFNFNARKGKLALNAYISGNFRPYSNMPVTYDRISTDSSSKTVLLHQDGSNRFLRGGYQSGIGFDYTINERNSLTGSLAYNHFNYNGSGFVNQIQTISDKGTGNIISELSSLNNTNNSFQFHNVDASLDYKKTFAREDQELDISANSSLGNRNGANSNMQYYMPQDSLYYGTNSKNPGKENESEFKVDYTQPLKKDVLLGVGGKLSLMDISSTANVLRYQPDPKTFLPDLYLTNSLSYHQKVYALYSELTFPVAKLFDAKIGGRYERTNINSYYSNAQHQAKIPGYNTFVPSVFFSKKIGDNQMVKLNYSKRIERPDFWDLNPFINTSDPKNISAGNPYLQPEIGNRYEIGYSRDFDKAGSIMLNAFYRTSNHDIQRYVVYYPSLKVGDSTYTNVSVTTRENIGLEKSIGINAFGDLHLFGKLNVRTNFFVFRMHTLNLIDPSMTATSINYRVNMNMSYQFSSTVTAEFFGNFHSARRQLQGIYPSFTSYSFAIRKQFWNKKGSLAFTTVNPFNEYVNQTTQLHGSNFNVTSVRKIPFRSFGLNFTWRFGKLEFKKNKDDNNMNLSLPTERG